MLKVDNPLLPILFDEKGKVLLYHKALKGILPIDHGVGWNTMLPGTPFRNNAFASFCHSQEIWHVDLSEISDPAGNYYLALVEKYSPGNRKTDLEIDRMRQEIAFYQAIMNNACDEVYVTDGQGITIYANPVSEKNYGVPVDELIGKSVWELEERGIYHPAVTPLVLKEKKSITIEQETALGKRLMITASPVFSPEGEIKMVICNSRDITALDDMKNSYRQIKAIVSGTREKRQPRVSRGKGEYPVFSAESPMVDILNMAQKIARTDSTVLLLGDSGTGKDLVAKYIHRLSERKEKPYLKVNCAALPRELLESELFGYKPGAFTGASPRGKAGLFTLADGGTIFLDEIAEIPGDLQPKLLQVIEEQTFTPIGSNEVKHIDVHIIAATNRDLREMIYKGTFREDLYYRLHVLSINIPPLNERREDIPILINHFLTQYARKYKRSLQLSSEALEVLSSYAWPGNIRELKHTMEHLIVMSSSDTVTIQQLPAHIISHAAPPGQTLAEILAAVEQDLIIKSYRELGSSYKVAHALGISQSSANRKIRKYLRRTFFSNKKNISK